VELFVKYRQWFAEYFLYIILMFFHSLLIFAFVVTHHFFGPCCCHFNIYTRYSMLLPK